MGAVARPKGDSYNFEATYGTSREFDEYVIAHPAGINRGTAIGRSLVEGKVAHIHDVVADPDYTYRGGQKLSGFRTMLAVPLLREGTPIGVLALGRLAVKPFTDKQIELVQTFADQAVIAIENVRLFDEVQKRTDDLSKSLEQQTATSEVLKVISGSPGELQPVFASIVESATRICEAAFADTNSIDLGGQRREIATLFTGIESFTALVETLEPSVLGPLLNEYLTGMTDIVFAHDGTFAKIVGDALHVLFGAPGEQPDHAARAIACALALDEYAQSIRDQCHKRGIALGMTRIAHAGPAIVGNFGGGRFFDYTAYGDTINVAARLEAANKQLGTRICVSATLAGKVERFQGRPVGDLILRGRSDALRAFEPMRAEQFEDPATASYLDAFGKLEATAPGATAAFAAHVGKYSDDQLASFHLKRLLNGATDADRDGINVVAPPTMQSNGMFPAVQRADNSETRPERSLLD